MVATDGREEGSPVVRVAIVIVWMAVSTAVRAIIQGQSRWSRTGDVEQHRVLDRFHQIEAVV